jgi:hypothetical protein
LKKVNARQRLFQFRSLAVRMNFVLENRVLVGVATRRVDRSSSDPEVLDAGILRPTFSKCIWKTGRSTWM